MILLPALYFSDEGFISIEEDSDGELIDEWTSDGIKFGKSLISHIVEIDKSLHEDRNLTSPQ